jgi:cobalt-zinc-cadmium efflux system outer membrane protein
VEVPLFDQKQSTVARSKAELKQAKALLKAKEDEVISEVRSKYARLVAVRSMAESYIESALPLHAQLIDSLQKHYNFMLVGVYDLLNAKKEESEAYHNFVETLKDYWILRSELELLTGEKMTYFPAAKMKEDKSPKPTMQEHHNHSQHGGNK